MSRKQHWEHIYRTRDAAQLSWFEPQPALSLRFIEAAALAAGARILDVGGGTSTLVDALLERGYQLGVLDVSAAAIGINQARLGARAAAVECHRCHAVPLAACVGPLARSRGISLSHGGG
jgi:2-polyprenyl-3-methyl-5-hydroxy-6-metoxy-1,4-benzoquinol methylase